MPAITIPPHDLEAEQRLIGGLLLHPVYLGRVKKILNKNDFYRLAHEVIFDVLSELKLKELDLVVVKDQLNRRKQLESCGGPEYLAQLATDAPGIAGWEHWVMIIKDCSTRRSLIACAADITAICMDMSTDTRENLSWLKSEIKQIDHSTMTGEIDNADRADAIYDQIYEIHKSGRPVGLYPGYKNLDEHIQFEPKLTYYFQGLPQTGKSALILNILLKMDVQYLNKYYLYFTLESHWQKLWFRKFAIETQIPSTRLQHGNIRSEDEWERLTEACNKFKKSNIIIYDDAKYQYLNQIISESESMAMDHDLGGIVIDYAQLIKMPSKKNRHLEMHEFANEVNFLAKACDCPVIVISQENKKGEMKESGDLFANADNVIQLQRDPGSNILNIKCRKGKDIRIFETTLEFHDLTVTFSDP